MLTIRLCVSLLGASLGMFYFGYNTGVVSAPANDIKNFINESHMIQHEVELTKETNDAIFTLIVVSFVVGGMAGSMSGGYVANSLGRKRGLLISQSAALIGSLVSSISKPTNAWEVLLVGRLITGLSAGLNTALVPMYLSEIAPVNLRGGLGVINQLSVTVGIFTGQILGLTQLLGNDGGWPWLMSISCFTAAVQLALLLFCPRSPRYLYISLDMEEEARKALRILRGPDANIENELKEMRAEKEAEQEPNVSIMKLFKSKKLRISLIICIVMHLSQQLSGINGIFYYAVPFFTKAGVEEEQAKLGNLGVGAIMVTMTLVTIPLMDRLGRRILHLTGLAGMCIMTILIIIAQNLSEDQDGEISNTSIFLIIVTLGFVVFFAVGPGSIPWMITGEMFTQGARPTATAVCVFVNWAANLLVGLMFDLVLTEYLKGFTFLPFTILLAIFFIFVFFFLPETKGKTVGETSLLIESKGWKSGRSYS